MTPLTVHTGVVSDAKLTGNPDDALALTVNGAAPKTLVLSGGKVMICALPAMVMAKFCVASGAVPLAALNVPANAPTVVGDPLMSPLLALSVRPGGSAAAITENVGGGIPVAVNRKL